MSRITKEIASAVAAQLVQSKVNELKEINQQKKDFITPIYLKTIPAEVLKQFRKTPEYFNKASSTRIIGIGVSDAYKYYAFTETLPDNNKTDRLSLTEDEGKIITGLINKADDKEKEIKELRNNIEAALYNLRTYANVEREFPEAFNLLPPSKTNTALALNIKDIRCKLDKANC